MLSTSGMVKSIDLFFFFTPLLKRPNEITMYILFIFHTFYSDLNMFAMGDIVSIFDIYKVKFIFKVFLCYIFNKYDVEVHYLSSSCLTGAVEKSIQCYMDCMIL